MIMSYLPAKTYNLCYSTESVGFEFVELSEKEQKAIGSKDLKGCGWFFQQEVVLPSSWMDELWLLMPLKGVADFFLLSIQSFNFMCLFTVPYCIATKHINFFRIKTLNPI